MKREILAVALSTLFATSLMAAPKMDPFTGLPTNYVQLSDSEKVLYIDEIRKEATIVSTGVQIKRLVFAIGTCDVDFLLRDKIELYLNKNNNQPLIVAVESDNDTFANRMMFYTDSKFEKITSCRHQLVTLKDVGEGNFSNLKPVKKLVLKEINNLQ